MTRFTISFFLVIFVFSLSLTAQDRLFTYTYQSGVLSKGLKEVELWNTFRTGRENYYARLDHRAEFEVGLGSKVQTAFYFNMSSTTETLELEGNKWMSSEQEFGFSNEWKVKILDAVAHPIGLALYGEYGIMSNEYEFEAKLILDKNMDKFTLASNLVYEKELVPVIEDNKNVWESETKAEYLLSGAYRFSPAFYITLENSLQNVYEEGKIEHSAIYSGAGFSYNNEGFWINLSFLPQLKSFKGDTEHALNLNEFEKLQIRLLLSYEI